MSDQVNPLLELLRLAAATRAAPDVRSLGFVIANETHRLAPYRQAFFCVRKETDFRLETISGLAVVDRNTPFYDWFELLLADLERMSPESVIAALEPSQCSEQVRQGWEEWLPAHVTLVRLAAPGTDSCIGLLLLAAEQPLQKFEEECLKELSSTYGHALKALTIERTPRRLLAEALAKLPRRRVMIALLLVLLLPVRQNSIGSAEVTPLTYSLISAPLDSVVSAVMVNPNERVIAGQVLFLLDDEPLRNRIETARGSMEVAQSEAFASEQKAFTDSQARNETATYLARVREKETSISYLSELRKKTEVRAPSAGVVLFGDKTDWEGKPVVVGERVMMLADTSSAGVTIWVPAADAINLERGAKVRLFLHTDPLHARNATVLRSSYQPQVSPEGIAAYRVTASFASAADLPRLGLRGTAKIYGNRVVLAYYLCRRPLLKVRQWLGI
jgi:biotin carboxyl carrier protein